MDPLRLVAALAVIYSHSFILLGDHEPHALEWRSGVFMTWGTVAVCVFFTISGFLVTESWDSDPNAIRWATRRVARIWPALAVVLLALAFVIGPAVTTIPVGTYLRSGTTYEYVVSHLHLGNNLYLPGVFVLHSLHRADGALWTLQLEVLAYAVLLVLAVTGALRQPSLLVGLTVGLVAWSWAQDQGQLALPAYEHGVYEAYLLRLLQFFLLGAVASRLALRFDWRLAALAATFLAATRDRPVSGVAAVALAYVILWVGTRPWHAIGRVRRLGDPSYGTYLWGWPLQELIIGAGLRNPYLLTLSAGTVALGLGYLSWHAVERRSLAYVRRRLAQQPEGPGATATALSEGITSRMSGRTQRWPVDVRAE